MVSTPAEPVSPSIFVPRLASDLKCPDEIRQQARTLAKKAEERGVTTGVYMARFAAVRLYKPRQEQDKRRRSRVSAVATLLDYTGDVLFYRLANAAPIAIPMPIPMAIPDAILSIATPSATPIPAPIAIPTPIIVPSTLSFASSEPISTDDGECYEILPATQHRNVVLRRANVLSP